MKSATLLIFFISIFTFCKSQMQAPPPTKEQDSIAKVQAEASKYLDSLTAKLSIKEFRDFLYESISGKEYNEGTFVNLYNFFMQTKLNAWLAQRAKKQPPKPTAKN